MKLSGITVSGLDPYGDWLLNTEGKKAKIGSRDNHIFVTMLAMYEKGYPEQDIKLAANKLAYDYDMYVAVHSKYMCITKSGYGFSDCPDITWEEE